MPELSSRLAPESTYFFTVNLLQRHGNGLLARHAGLLRDTVRAVWQRHPFMIHGWVVLPEHLHCVIEPSSVSRGREEAAQRRLALLDGVSLLRKPCCLAARYRLCT